MEIRDGVSLRDGFTVEADVQTIGEDFLTDLKVKGEGTFICDRCGKQFQRSLKGKMRAFFSYETNLEEGEDDEIKLLQPSDHELNISHDVLDMLILSVPAKVLCDENCQGLCPHCGADLNSEKCSCAKEETPSPWDALKNIHFD